MGYLRNPAQGWPSSGGRVKGWGDRNPTVWFSSRGIHNLQLLGGLMDCPESVKNVNVHFKKPQSYKCYNYYNVQCIPIFSYQARLRMFTLHLTILLILSQPFYPQN